MEAYGYESDFYQGFVDPLIVDGQQYAFPYGPSTTVVYYNKDLLQEVSGLTEFPSTWEETKTWAEEFHKATGKAGLSTPGAGSTFNYVNTLLLNTGVDPIGDGCLMGDEKVVTWVKDMKTLVEDGAIEWVNTGSSTETDLKTKFINGETAAIVYSSTFYDTALETVDFDIGVTLVPENANNLSTTAGATLFIPAQNDQNVKNAAFQFLTFITNEENAKEFALESAYLPTRKSLLEGDNINDFLALYPDMINIYNNMDTIVAKNPSPYFTKAITAIGEDLSLIFNGGQDVDETIPKIVEEVNYILEGN
jgi:ABC-type glycerol-3-phosphate transport system substrate-binding protein